MVKNSIIAMISILPYTAAIATEVTVEIEGSGTVELQNAQSQCDNTCTFNISSERETLIATPTSGWSFQGWLGGQCDSGNGVLSDDNETAFANATSGAKTLASADINGDGLEDLALIDLFGQSVDILLNQGDGSFNEAQTLLDFSYPSALSFYDWDNDGDEDLFVADFNANATELFSNDGNGQFSYQQSIKIPEVRPYAIAVADIDFDGNADLLVSSFSADTSGDLFNLVESISQPTTAWYRQTESGFVEHIQLSSLAAFTVDAAVTENNEVWAVAAELAESSVTLYRSNGMETTSTIIDSGPNPYGTTLGDVDKNGTLDVLSTFYRPSRVQLTQNIGDGVFLPSVVVDELSEGVAATAILDMNNDGLNDLAVSEFNNHRFIYYETLSYLQCNVLASSNASVTAKFVENTEQQVIDETPQEETISNGSGGGSMTWFWSILFGLFLFRLR